MVDGGQYLKVCVRFIQNWNDTVGCHIQSNFKSKWATFQIHYVSGWIDQYDIYIYI